MQKTILLLILIFSITTFAENITKNSNDLELLKHNNLKIIKTPLDKEYIKAFEKALLNASSNVEKEENNKIFSNQEIEDIRIKLVNLINYSLESEYKNKIEEKLLEMLQKDFLLYFYTLEEFRDFINKKIVLAKAGDVMQLPTDDIGLGGGGGAVAGATAISIAAGGTVILNKSGEVIKKVLKEAKKAIKKSKKDSEKSEKAEKNTEKPSNKKNGKKKSKQKKRANERAKRKKVEKKLKETEKKLKKAEREIEKLKKDKKAEIFSGVTNAIDTVVSVATSVLPTNKTTKKAPAPKKAPASRPHTKPSVVHTKPASRPHTKPSVVHTKPERESREHNPMPRPEKKEWDWTDPLKGIY